MTTSQSPLRLLKAQADKVARMLKATERGEKVVEDVGGKIAASLAAGTVRFAVAMDDKLLTIDMTWATRTIDERGRACRVHPETDAWIPGDEPLTALRLDSQGRCPNCLLKPLPYRRDGHFFCHRCCRAYSIESGAQVQNWAWKTADSTFTPTYPSSEYVTIQPTEAAKRRAAR